MTVVFNTRRVIAEIATLAGAVLIQTFESVIGPEAQEKSGLGTDNLARPPSHFHTVAAE
jgi:hypothetical protein